MAAGNVKMCNKRQIIKRLSATILNLVFVSILTSCDNGETVSRLNSSKDSDSGNSIIEFLDPLIFVLSALFVLSAIIILLNLLWRMRRCEITIERNLKLLEQYRDTERSARYSTNKSLLANGMASNSWGNQPDYVTRSEFEQFTQQLGRNYSASNQAGDQRLSDQQTNPPNAVEKKAEKLNAQTNANIITSTVSQSVDELKKIFNRYDYFSEQEIIQIQRKHNFASMRVEQYVTGALSSAGLSDSTDKDARYLRPAQPFNKEGQFYVIPNPQKKNYSEIELNNLNSLFSVPLQSYDGNRPINLVNPAIIVRNGKTFSLVQKGQIEII